MSPCHCLSLALEQIYRDMPAADVDLIAVFVPRQQADPDPGPTPGPTSYLVTGQAGTGGSISPARKTVTHGKTTPFTVMPNTGYSIDTVSGCGGSLDGSTYTTGPITGACTVTATFSLNSYTVTSTAGTGGGISPTTRTVNHGATTTFTLTPDSGYFIASATGCGGSLSGHIYITGAITGNCNVAASFSLQQTEYMIAVFAEPAEAGVVQGGGAYSANQNVTVRAAAHTGWVFQHWTEDGVVVSRKASYTFSVTRDRTLVAHFKRPVALPGVMLLLME